MRRLILALAIAFNTQAFAAEHDLVDYCGLVEYRGGEASVTAQGKVYAIVSGAGTSVEQLRQAVPHGTRQCIRGWQDMNDPRTLILFDYFSFQMHRYHADCKVTQVIDGDFYEEGLSVEEYPDVYVK